MREAVAKKIRKEAFDPKDAVALLDDLDRRLTRLKFFYDQYFRGFEKREPTTALKDVVRIIYNLGLIDFPRSGAKFRFRALVQKYNSYRGLWNRQLREVETGTSKRQLMRIARKMERQGETTLVARLRAAKSVGQIERELVEAARKAKEADAIVKAPDTGVDLQHSAFMASSSPEGDVGPSAQRMKAIFEEFVQAKKKNGERADKVKLSSVKKAIGKQIPGIVEKYKAKSVDFRVAVKDGKVILQAIPRR